MLHRATALALFVAAIAAFAVSSCTVAEKANPVPTTKNPPVPSAMQGKQGPPDYVVGGFEADVPSQTLTAGQETFPCYIVPLTLTGPSHVVGAGMVDVGGPGMHHGNITARPSTCPAGQTCSGPRECPADVGVIGGEAQDVIAGGSVLFGSSTQLSGSEWRTFPDGMGFPIGDDFEIVMRLHFLNATGKTVTLAPHYQWYTIDESKVSKLLGPFIWDNEHINIPPNSKMTLTSSCAQLTNQAPEEIVSLMPHMHALGTHFNASFFGGALDGTTFLDSPGYNPDGVIVAYTPAVDLGQGATSVDAGEGFSWSCTWDNTTNDTITYGVGSNEMCMAFGYAWPYSSAYSAVASDPTHCLVISPPPVKGFNGPM